MSDPIRIGLCGGTFDPFHLGHSRPVLEVREAMGWDEVIYIPAFQQPFKLDRFRTSPFHRYAMTVLGTEAHAGLKTSLFELEREKTSFTIDTLLAFRQQYPDAVIDWIIGDDNVPALTEWKSWERLFDLSNFIVLSREPRRPEVPVQLAARVVPPGERGCHGALAFAANETIKVSSTELRRRIASNEDTGDLLDPRVARYISAHGLYRTEEKP